MREILFRGKRLDNGERVEGSLIVYGMYPKIFTLPHREQYEVDARTVGQFTGLMDKNGRKIFEGDIVETQTQDTKQLRRAEVCFGEFADINSSEGECYIGFYIVFDGIFTTAGQLKDYANFIEVIGNIHDNPELLGGAE